MQAVVVGQLGFQPPPYCGPGHVWCRSAPGVRQGDSKTRWTSRGSTVWPRRTSYPQINHKIFSRSWSKPDWFRLPKSAYDSPDARPLSGSFFAELARHAARQTAAGGLFSAVASMGEPVGLEAVCWCGTLPQKRVRECIEDFGTCRGSRGRRCRLVPSLGGNHDCGRQHESRPGITLSGGDHRAGTPGRILSRLLSDFDWCDVSWRRDRVWDHDRNRDSNDEDLGPSEGP